MKNIRNFAWGLAVGGSFLISSAAFADAWVVCSGPLKGASVDENSILPDGNSANRSSGMAAACDSTVPENSDVPRNAVDPERVRRQASEKRVLTHFARGSCSISEDAISESEAVAIADCFQNSDFWQADRGFSHLAGGKNIAGTGTGLAMKCSLAMGISCEKSFLRLGVQAHLSERVVIIDKAGKYEISGYGAGAGTFVVAPGVAAQIELKGHSQVYFGEGVSCEQKDNFSGCIGLNEAGDSSLNSTFRQFVTAACRPRGFLGWIGHDTITKEQVENVVSCFREADFWESSKYESLANEENIAGTGTGLAMACTRAIGIECKRPLMRVGVDLKMGHLKLLGGGSHEVDGFGAASGTYVIKPNSGASVSVAGHSTVYYLPDKNSRCFSRDYPSGCTPIVGGR